jgi:tRNA pseudouridine13 synthase
MFDCDFAYAYTGPLGTADYRCHWDDFVVDEVLGFTPEAEGEHDYLQLKKRGVNTEWLAKQLAQFAGIRSMDVGYAGMKDRHASTTQWFSLYRPKGQPLPWADFLAQLDDDVSLVSISRGTKKLRPGSHQGNRFAIRLRHLEAPHAELDARLEQIAQQGFPNYFGEQRFGINGQNLEAAAAWLDKGRPGGNQGKGCLLYTSPSPRDH